MPSGISNLARTAALLLAWSGAAQAAPNPIIDARFDEQSGLVAANSGTLAGQGEFFQESEFPVFTSQVPTGSMTPKNNVSAVDFGGIAAGQGGRAIDFITGADGTLGPLSAFTLTGWINPRDLTIGWGGNRILFALSEPNRPGFDLVHLSNGPSYTAPAVAVTDSSAEFRVTVTNPSGRVTSDAATLTVMEENGHKVFLSFSEGGTTTTNRGNLSGSGSFVQRDGFPITSASTPSGPYAPPQNLASVDFGAMLDNQGGRAIDFKAPAYQSIAVEPVAITSQPLNELAFAGQSVAFNVVFAGSPPVSVQWQRDGQDIPGATQSTLTLQSVSASDNGARFQVRITNRPGPSPASPPR